MKTDKISALIVLFICASSGMSNALFLERQKIQKKHRKTLGTSFLHQILREYNTSPEEIDIRNMLLQGPDAIKHAKKGAIYNLEIFAFNPLSCDKGVLEAAASTLDEFPELGNLMVITYQDLMDYNTEHTPASAKITPLWTLLLPLRYYNNQFENAQERLLLIKNMMQNLLEQRRFFAQTLPNIFSFPHLTRNALKYHEILSETTQYNDTIIESSTTMHWDLKKIAHIKKEFDRKIVSSIVIGFGRCRIDRNNALSLFLHYAPELLLTVFKHRERHLKITNGEFFEEPFFKSKWEKLIEWFPLLTKYLAFTDAPDDQMSGSITLKNNNQFWLNSNLCDDSFGENYNDSSDDEPFNGTQLTLEDI